MKHHIFNTFKRCIHQIRVKGQNPLCWVTTAPPRHHFPKLDNREINTPCPKIGIHLLAKVKNNPSDLRLGKILYLRRLAPLFAPLQSIQNKLRPRLQEPLNHIKRNPPARRHAHLPIGLNSQVNILHGLILQVIFNFSVIQSYFFCHNFYVTFLYPSMMLNFCIRLFIIYYNISHIFFQQKEVRASLKHRTSSPLFLNRQRPSYVPISLPPSFNISF